MRRLLPLVLLLLSATTFAQPRLVVQTGHTDLVTVVDISPDGSLLVTGSRDRTARLWQFSSGKELAFLAHESRVNAVRFSPDGQHLITASGNADVRVFSVRSGELLHSFRNRGSTVALTPEGDRFVSAHWTNSLVVSAFPAGDILLEVPIEDAVTAISVSPDGSAVLYGTSNGGIFMRSIADGGLLGEFAGHAAAVVSLEFSPDGSRILSGSSDGTAMSRDLVDGNVRTLRAHDERSGREPGVNSATFSPDGRWILTGQADWTARLWSAESGAEVKVFRGHQGMFNQVHFAPDGEHFLSTSHDRTARLWSIGSDETIREFRGEVDEVLSLDVHPDRSRLSTGSGFVNRSVSQWSLPDGGMTSRLHLDAGSVAAVRYSADGRRLAANGRPYVYVWDTATRRLVSKADPRFAHKITDLDFAPDGRRVVVSSFDGSARIVDSDDGKLAQWRFDTPSVIEGQPNHLISTAWSADGQYVVTGQLVKAYEEVNHAVLWRPATGEKVREFGPFPGAVDSAEFSRDSRRLLLTSANTVWILDVETGEIVSRWPQDRPVVTSIWSGDGDRIVTAGVAVRLLDASSGRLIRQYDGHIGNVDDVRILNERVLVTVGRDGTTRLWNLETGAELARLISFNDGAWAVVDNAGRFDASNGGDVAGMHWVITDEAGDYEVIALSQLKQRFYEPGLLAKLMGFNDEPIRDVESMAQAGVDLSPRVTVTHAPDIADPVLRVTVDNRGGGIGPVRVLVNRKEVAADARPPGSDPDAQTLQIALDLLDNPFFLPDADNAIDVVASNAEQTLTSRGGRIRIAGVSTPGGQRTSIGPRLWGIAVGISDYSGEEIDLSFAQKDAQSFADALTIAASSLVGPERVDVRLIGGGASRATRDTIRIAFEDIAGKSNAADILVIYMAGHGVSWGSGDNADYYYLLQDAGSLDVSDRAVRQHATMSSAELTELIKSVPALKQVLILDTCASGQIVDDLATARGVSSSQMRSLERMKDRTGMFILAGSAADAVSYETSRYGQGLLTYSLLTGMRGAALREDEFVDVGKLFSHAADEVQKLVGGLGGVQQPRIGLPQGGESFDIGRVTATDRRKIAVQSPKPIVMQSSFRGPRPRDDLDFASRVDAALRDAAADKGSGFVFFDIDRYEDAIQIAGDYRMDGDQVAVRAVVFAGDNEAGSFEVQGSSGDLDGLAARVVESARTYIN